MAPSMMVPVNSDGRTGSPSGAPLEHLGITWVAFRPLLSTWAALRVEPLGGLANLRVAPCEAASGRRSGGDPSLPGVPGVLCVFVCVCVMYVVHTNTCIWI